MWKRVFIKLLLEALLGVVWFVLWQSSNDVTGTSIAKIHPGLSRTEVEAIIGPPGDYRSGPTAYIVWDGPPDGYRNSREELWWFDFATFVASFDESDTLNRRYCFPAKKEQLNILDNLHWRFLHLSRCHQSPQEVKGGAAHSRSAR
jgi:hypothetical protein